MFSWISTMAGDSYYLDTMQTGALLDRWDRTDDIVVISSLLSRPPKPRPSHGQDQCISRLRRDQDFEELRPNQGQDQGGADQDLTSASFILHETLTFGTYNTEALENMKLFASREYLWNNLELGNTKGGRLDNTSITPRHQKSICV